VKIDDLRFDGLTGPAEGKKIKLSPITKGQI